MKADKGFPSVFDSISQCASATGIPLSVIRKAKADGCSAFKSNRIFFKVLLKWLFKNSQAHAVDDAKSRMAIAEANLKEEQFREESGENASRNMEMAKAALVKIVSPMRTDIIAMPALLAARCNPSDPELARNVLQPWADALLKSTQV